MALRDQPYLPLYVQDFLTDEKLILCSAAAHGVYIRLLCILHKQKNYGTLLLGQNFRQTPNKFINFANILSKQMPFKVKEIAKTLKELSDLDVILINEIELSQKRMVRDGKLSIIRSCAGKKGAAMSSFALAKPSANTLANSETETETETASLRTNISNITEGVKKKNLI